MKKFGIAELKARLSSLFRAARRGHLVTGLDRGTPVATITVLDPTDSLRARHPLRRLSVRLPAPVARPVDSLSALAAERSGR